MSKTYRLAATQVTYRWPDRGAAFNPYSEEFDPATVPAHIEKNTSAQLALFEDAGKQGADLVVGAEDLQRLGHYGNYLDDRSIFKRLVETIPGPTSKRIGAIARRYRMYICACYPERDRKKYYNTGVLFSRAGRIIGKYRKMELPCGEDWIYSPGTTYPVFKTEMGNVAIAICYDMMFPEVIRCLALSGADVICHPTMGYGWTEVMGEATVRSRAVDNGVTIIVSHGKRSQVVNPWGEIMVDAGRRQNVVVFADVDPKATQSQPDNHYGTVGSGIADVRERWTKQRLAGTFKVIASKRPPLMKRYSKTMPPRTKAEIRAVYEKLKEEHRRVAKGLAARYTWG
jgi:predicted amidohydrolase